MSQSPRQGDEQRKQEGPCIAIICAFLQKEEGEKRKVLPQITPVETVISDCLQKKKIYIYMSTE